MSSVDSYFNSRDYIITELARLKPLEDAVSELVRLKPLQDAVSALHEEMRCLRSELAKNRSEVVTYIINDAVENGTSLKCGAHQQISDREDGRALEVPRMADQIETKGFDEKEQLEAASWKVAGDLREDGKTIPHVSIPFSSRSSGKTKLIDLDSPEDVNELTRTSTLTTSVDIPEATPTEKVRLESFSQEPLTCESEAQVVCQLRNSEVSMMQKRHRSQSKCSNWEPTISSETFKKSAINRRYNCRRRQLHPDSFPRSIWDLSSCFALAFDSIMIPFMLTFDPDTEGFILFAMFFTAVFWTLDIFATLNTSFFTTDGDLETRPIKIFRRYLKQTLVLDAFICTTDWLGIYAEVRSNKGSEGGDAWSLLRLVKINRIFRLASVLRVSRLWDRIERLNRTSLSNTWQILAQITAIFVMICWVNHIVCCVWYAVGVTSNSDTGQSWLRAAVNSDNPMPIEDSSLLYQYTTAYHWSISQLTPGSMQVMPMNSLERIVNISCLLFGLLFVTSLISRMSALMVQLQLSNRDTNEVVRKLRFFLRQKNVTASVAQRIERQIVTQLKMVKPLTMNDIPILSSLSKPLRIELKCDLYSQHLLRHSVLRVLLTSFYSGAGQLAMVSRELKSVCDALECIQLKTSEELFRKGDVTQRSYILVQGCLLYSVNEVAEPVKMSTTSTWVSSAALWIEWETRGYMEADSLCEVACVDARKVLPIVCAQHQRLTSLVKHYQNSFARLLKDVALDSTSDLEEVVDHALVVFSLPEANKLEICEPILESLRQRAWFWGSAQEQAFKDLEMEVSKGKSVLVPSEDGSPVRVAIVTALRVYRPHGEMFVQVMDIKGSELSCVCRLPGTKTGCNEVPSISARRLIDEVQEYLGDDCQELSPPMPHSTDIQKSTSSTYGILTQYHRHIFESKQHATSKSCPPRIQFEVEKITRSRTALRNSANELPGVNENVVKTYLVSRMPWLESHVLEHLHVIIHPSGKGAVYTWIYPDELMVMQGMLKQTSD